MVVTARSIIRGGYYTLVIRVARFPIRELLGLVSQFVKLSNQSALSARTL